MGKEIVSNRKAYHNYAISDKIEAGIVLLGTEIKSLRQNGGSLQEAYVRLIRGEVWLIGAYIAPYKQGNIHNHEERRERKLLLHRYEIERLASQVNEKGITLVPLSLSLNNGRAKLLIGVGKGKKLHDKRKSIRDKESRREADRAMKNSG